MDANWPWKNDETVPFATKWLQWLGVIMLNEITEETKDNCMLTFLMWKYKYSKSTNYITLRTCENDCGFLRASGKEWEGPWMVHLNKVKELELWR